MRIFVCLLFMLGVFLAVSAQQVEISGRVADSKGQPVSYANITLQHSDSTFVTGCTSDEKGRFVINKLANIFCRIHYPGNQVGQCQWHT